MLNPTIMDLPSVVAIEYMHRHYAGDEARFTLVFAHCQAVWEIARQLIERHHLPVDAKLVRAGALLHDIGLYGLEADEPPIRHGAVGAWMLQKAGYAESLCRFASCHTGAGLTSADIQREQLPLPLKDFVPETPEEQLVAYADKFHSMADPPRLINLDGIRKELAKHGTDQLRRFDHWVAAFGVPDLKLLSAELDCKVA